MHHFHGNTSGNNHNLMMNDVNQIVVRNFFKKEDQGASTAATVRPYLFLSFVNGMKATTHVGVEISQLESTYLNMIDRDGIQ